MKQCWRCRTTTSENMIHHVNGNHEDEKPQNLLRLCLKCHDLVQGICDKCNQQKDCYIQKLQRCWRFEDALPPIYFRPKQESNGNGQGKVNAKPQKVKKINNIINLTKFGHQIESSMISGTYLKSPEFLKHFVKCDLCGDWVKWKLSSGMERIICARCTIGLSGSPRPRQGRKRNGSLRH